MIPTLSCANCIVVAAAVFIGAMPPRVAQTVTKQGSDVTRPSRDAIITLTGCLQRERDVLESTGAGTADEFVLTFTKLTSGRIRFLAQPGSYGVICRLAGQGESRFAQYVGHEMEITGFITNRKSVTAATDSPDSVSGTPAAAPVEHQPNARKSSELPKVNVSAFRDLSDGCQRTP
jgi:hypothetical protein